MLAVAVIVAVISTSLEGVEKIEKTITIVHCDFADCKSNTHRWFKNGTASEDFEWLDLIEKIN